MWVVCINLMCFIFVRSGDCRKVIIKKKLNIVVNKVNLIF